MLARDIMTPSPRALLASDTVYDAARAMRDEDVGALPICDQAGRLSAMVTDRDIVVRCVAGDGSPEMPAVLFAMRDPVTTTADQPVREIAALMRRHHIRRIPVVEGDDLIGMISATEVAQAGWGIDLGEAAPAVSE